MAYQSWSVVFGEQPSAAKWNILGTNDAAFNSGNGVLSTGLGLSSSYTGGVATQANAGSAGGTIYYINLGGIRYCWGGTAAVTASGTGTVASSSVTITLPTSFFTTLQSVNYSTGPASNTQYILASAIAQSVTTLTVQIVQFNGTNGTAVINFWVVGT